MLKMLKESDFVKKIIVSIYIFISFLILLIIISPQPIKGNPFIIIIFFSSFLSLSLYIYHLNPKDWLKLNIDYLKLNIKLMLYFFGCSVIALTSEMDYLDAFKNILTLSSVFVFGIFTFITFTKNKKDILLSFNLLKIFSAVFVLMSVMFYNTYKDAVSLENDYYKTKITYLDNKIEKENIIKDYENFIESTLKLYTPEEININSKNESLKKEKRKFHLFTNIASTIIIITIIMCTIFLITSSSIFKINKENIL